MARITTQPTSAYPKGTRSLKCSPRPEVLSAQIRAHDQCDLQTFSKHCSSLLKNDDLDADRICHYVGNMCQEDHAILLGSLYREAESRIQSKLKWFGKKPSKKNMGPQSSTQGRRACHWQISPLVLFGLFGGQIHKSNFLDALKKLAETCPSLHESWRRLIKARRDYEERTHRGGAKRHGPWLRQHATDAIELRDSHNVDALSSARSTTVREGSYISASGGAPSPAASTIVHEDSYMPASGGQHQAKAIGQTQQLERDSPFIYRKRSCATRTTHHRIAVDSGRTHARDSGTDILYTDQRPEQTLIAPVFSAPYDESRHAESNALCDSSELEDSLPDDRSSTASTMHVSDDTYSLPIFDCGSACDKQDGLAPLDTTEKLGRTVSSHHEHALPSDFVSSPSPLTQKRAKPSSIPTGSHGLSIFNLAGYSDEDIELLSLRRTGIILHPMDGSDCFSSDEE